MSKRTQSLTKGGNLMSDKRTIGIMLACIAPMAIGLYNGGVATASAVIVFGGFACMIGGLVALLVNELANATRR
jgi:hypothetical protein